MIFQHSVKVAFRCCRQLVIVYMFIVQYLSVKCAVLMHLSFTHVIDFGVVFVYMFPTLNVMGHGSHSRWVNGSWVNSNDPLPALLTHSADHELTHSADPISTAIGRNTNCVDKSWPVYMSLQFRSRRQLRASILRHTNRRMYVPQLHPGWLRWTALIGRLPRGVRGSHGPYVEPGSTPSF